MHCTIQESSCGIVANVMDCGITVSRFELWSHYYIHFQTNLFGKSMNPLILPLNCLDTILYLYCSSTRMALTLNNPFSSINNHSIKKWIKLFEKVIHFLIRFKTFQRLFVYLKYPHGIQIGLPINIKEI